MDLKIIDTSTSGKLQSRQEEIQWEIQEFEAVQELDNWTKEFDKKIKDKLDQQQRIIEQEAKELELQELEKEKALKDKTKKRKWLGINLKFYEKIIVSVLSI